MKAICSSLASLLALAAASPAQCLYTTMTTQTVGAGCNVGSTGFCKVVGLPTTTVLTLDVQSCALDMQVNLFEACGVVVPLRAVAVGFQQIAVSLPDLGLGCMLHVSPDLVLSTGSGPLQLDLPLGLPFIGFYVQAIALSLAPLGGQGSDGFTLSDAMWVDIQ